ncbi:MAG: hypothetical protein WCS21_07735 [Lachnospiraceae bacterium]
MSIEYAYLPNDVIVLQSMTEKQREKIKKERQPSQLIAEWLYVHPEELRANVKLTSYDSHIEINTEQAVESWAVSHPYVTIDGQSVSVCGYTIYKILNNRDDMLDNCEYKCLTLKLEVCGIDDEMTCDGRCVPIWVSEVPLYRDDKCNSNAYKSTCGTQPDPNYENTDFMTRLFKRDLSRHTIEVS